MTISQLEHTLIRDSDDLDYLPVLASLPANETVFEYLVGCWERLNSRRSALIQKVNAIHPATN